ncbi:hypothetical protein [Pseudarthrobacter equi]|uniref:hypothetical protein n=1 Tax=Pseudarthrobacter equi TaxID=728066 RepID=UPI0028D51A5B|nr:hypothetical protein [Pseudarthrobacter equi]
MTTPESRLRELVDEVLTDAGHPDDAALRSALESIGFLASLPVPEPSGELARLLAGGGDELARRRRSNRHRPTVVGLAVIAGMGLGIGGVAATAGSAPGSSAASVQHLLGDWSPDWAITHGVPAAPTPEYRGVAVPADQTPDSVPAASSASGSAGTPEGTGIPQGKELRPHGEGLAGSAGRPECGSPKQTAATPAGICPPAAEPSGQPDGPSNHIGGGSTRGTAAPGNADKKKVPDEGIPGHAVRGQDQADPGAPGRALENSAGPGKAGPKQAADSGPGRAAPEKPGPASSRQGTGTGDARVTAAGGK